MKFPSYKQVWDGYRKIRYEVTGCMAVFTLIAYITTYRFFEQNEIAFFVAVLFCQTPLIYVLMTLVLRGGLLMDVLDELGEDRKSQIANEKDVLKGYNEIIKNSHTV